ncbi:MAG: Gfo/Idh/MocA family oxidoreductase [Pseudolabrys sp.]|nr:Gfo/Idh/MocA family oxidoreductase [Pseudolabrys sp.]MDP2295753.1 Gfo/Idh/MocA family oxidoreductase [Pseudolabrys sp.]
MSLGRPPVRIGIVGGGMISQVAHLPFYLQNRSCEMVAVAEARPSLSAVLSKQLGAERVVPDYRTLLADPSIAAVVICAPRPATGPLTLEALEAGKHVLTEKPMAHSVAQAQRLVDAAAARSLIYAVGFMKRYDAGVQAAKTLFDRVLRDGRLGRLLLVRVFDFSNAYAMAPPPHHRPAESRSERFATWDLFPDWLPEPLRNDFAWFANAGSHDVNLLRYFCAGEMTVSGAERMANGSLTALLRWGEVPAALEVSKTTAGRWLEGAEFLFERGRITVNIPSPMAVDAVAEVVLDDLAAGLAGQIVPGDNGWCFARQADGFVDALTGGAPPLTTGAEGLADLALTERIWRTLES